MLGDPLLNVLVLAVIVGLVLVYLMGLGVAALLGLMKRMSK